MMDAMNDAGSQLVELVDEPAATAVSTLMTQDSEKYENVSDVVQRRSDKIKSQRQKSVEVCQLLFLFVFL